MKKFAVTCISHPEEETGIQHILLGGKEFRDFIEKLMPLVKGVPTFKDERYIAFVFNTIAESESGTETKVYAEVIVEENTFYVKFKIWQFEFETDNISIEQLKSK